MARRASARRLTLIDRWYVDSQREQSAEAWIIGSALRDAGEHKLAIRFFNYAQRYAAEARRVMGIS